MTKLEKKWVILFTAIALLLCIIRLTDVFVWADEGETLLLGQMTLRHGVPRAFDADYQLCFEKGLTPQGLWTAQPWLLFYFTAGLIFLFGKSLFFLRLPFVLFGVATIPLLFSLVKKLGFSRRIALFAAGLASVNVPMLLLFRQVRYYPLQIFLSVLLVWLYAGARDNRKHFWWMMGVASALFVHIMPPVFLGVIMAIAAHAFLFERRGGVKKSLVHSQLLMLALFLPWFIYVAPSLWEFYSIRSSSTLGRNMGVGAWLLGGLLFLVTLVNYHFPLLSLVLLNKKNWRAFAKEPRKFQSIWLLLMVILAICFSMSFFFNSNLWPGYVAAAIPFMLILSSCFIDVIFARWRRFGIILLVMFVFSNWLNLPRIPFYNFFISSPDGANKVVRRLQTLQINLLHKKPSYLFFEYLGELMGNYDGPVENIVNYLKQHGTSDDTFFTTNDFSSIYFFTDMKRVDHIPFESPPTWIFRRGKGSWGHFLCKNPENLNADAYVEDYLRQNHYEMIVLDVPNIYHENEPVPPNHLFSTSDVPERVTLFRRVPEVPVN